MTMTLPFLLITLHFSQIGFTELLTFIVFPPVWLLISPGYPAACKVVWRKLQPYLVAGQDADKVHSHLAGNVRQHFVVVFKSYLEHRVRQRFQHSSCYFYAVLF